MDTLSASRIRDMSSTEVLLDKNIRRDCNASL